MKKIIIFICLALFLYFFFSVKNNNQLTEKQHNENEKYETQTPEFLNSQINNTKSISASTTLKDTPSESVIPLHVNDENNITQKSTNNTLTTKRLITPGDSSYAIPPKFLGETSKIVFSFYYETDIQKYLLSNALITDIEQDFKNGIYPKAEIFKALDLTNFDTNSSFVDFASINPADHREMLDLELNIHTNDKIKPIQGFFNLKVNGSENSCTANKLSLFQNIVISRKDPGQILIKSCSESFYLQLYKHGSTDMSGLYYEKMSNGSYKVTGYVILMKAYPKDVN